MTEYIPAKVAQVVPAHYQIIDDRQCFCRLILGDAVYNAGQHVGAGNPQGLLDVFGLDLVAGKTDDLIESRLGVAH